VDEVLALALEGPLPTPLPAANADVMGRRATANGYDR